MRCAAAAKSSSLVWRLVELFIEERLLFTDDVVVISGSIIALRLIVGAVDSLLVLRD